MSAVTRDATTRRLISLPGGPIEVLLRPTRRARGLRATIDPRLGLVVSLPPPSRRGWATPEPLVEGFLREREAWLRRHLDRRLASLATIVERGPVRDGGLLRYRGTLHRLRVDGHGGSRTRVDRIAAPGGDPGGDEAEGGIISVRLGSKERRLLPDVLRDWCRSEARLAVEGAIERHRRALDVAPTAVSIRDPRTRWGSASRHGRLSFSWRLILAPPAALETVVVHELAHLRVFGHGPAFWSLVAGRRPDHALWRRWLRDHALELHAALEDPSRILGGFARRKDG